MAAPSYVTSLLAGFPPDQKRALQSVFDYVLTNLRLGRCAAGTRAENLQVYAVTGRTPATPDTEFSLPHGLGRAPYLLVPVLALDDVNSELVPLRVTRAPDASRVYLASSVGDAPFKVLLEA